MAKDSYHSQKLHEYVKTRGISMPFYTSGSKILEEAQELHDALQAFTANPSPENLAALQEEVADVVITASVVAQQFDFTVEDALDMKITKDKGRGVKSHEA